MVFKEDSVLNVIIADNGIGISPDKIPYIFDPFFTSKKTGEGTGLGLAICYNIIKEHNGEIKAESKYGSGTKMILTLPTSIK